MGLQKQVSTLTAEQTSSLLVGVTGAEVTFGDLCLDGAALAGRADGRCDLRLRAVRLAPDDRRGVRERPLARARLRQSARAARRRALSGGHPVGPNACGETGTNETHQLS